MEKVTIQNFNSMGPLHTTPAFSLYVGHRSPLLMKPLVRKSDDTLSRTRRHDRPLSVYGIDGL